MEDRLIHKITNTTILLIAISAIPLNVVIFFALEDGPYLLPRIIPVIMGAVIIVQAVFRKRIKPSSNIRLLTGLLFLVGCFNLSVGLIDTASLWFILFIVYTQFVSREKKPLWAFWISFAAISFTGGAMMAGFYPFPVNYEFQSCQFACVAVRIIHFLLIGYLIFYILNEFFTTIRSNMIELTSNASDLKQLNTKLEQKIEENINMQQEMLSAIVRTEEKERKRIASDLHDGLGPVLSAINLYFQAYVDAPDRNEKQNIENRLKDIINGAITETSRISHNISPLILEKHGIEIAVRHFTTKIQDACQHKINLKFDINQRFDLTRELTIYRTITELINNTLKHAQASEINIEIRKHNNRLIVKYTDDGTGFNTAGKKEKPHGLGLESIQNRIISMNGTINLAGSDNRGVKIDIGIPLVDNRFLAV